MSERVRVRVCLCRGVKDDCHRPSTIEDHVFWEEKKKRNENQNAR